MACLFIYNIIETKLIALIMTFEWSICSRKFVIYNLTFDILIFLLKWFFVKWIIQVNLDSLYDFQKQPPEVFYKKDACQNFVKYTQKHLYQSFFFIKVGGLSSATLLKRLLRKCFPVNFVKFSKKPFLQNTSGRLLLDFHCFTKLCVTNGID